jgi:hypothetical protein
VRHTKKKGKKKKDDFPPEELKEDPEEDIGEGLKTDCDLCLKEFKDDQMVRRMARCDHLYHDTCLFMSMKNRG